MQESSELSFAEKQSAAFSVFRKKDSQTRLFFYCRKGIENRADRKGYNESENVKGTVEWMEKKNNGRLLDILAGVRIETALEDELKSNKEYQQALKRQDDAVSRMDALKPGRKWERGADRVISAANHCGAVYGAAAYRLGFRDGVRVVSELKELA